MLSLLFVAKSGRLIPTIVCITSPPVIKSSNHIRTFHQPIPVGIPVAKTQPQCTTRGGICFKNDFLKVNPGSVLMEFVQNKASGKIFVVLDDTGGNGILVITPEGRVIHLGGPGSPFWKQKTIPLKRVRVQRKFR